jgi:hypothetical protein
LVEQRALANHRNRFWVEQRFSAALHGCHTGRL